MKSAESASSNSDPSPQPFADIINESSLMVSSCSWRSSLDFPSELELERIVCQARSIHCRARPTFASNSACCRGSIEFNQNSHFNNPFNGGFSTTG